MSSDNYTGSTESDCEYDSELDADKDMYMQDEVAAPDGVDLYGDVC